MTDIARTASSLPTVHGPPLEPGAGTVVDGHAHAWIDPPDGVASEHALALADEEFQAAALRDLAVTANAWATAREVEAAPRAQESNETPEVSGASGTWPAGLIDCQPPFAGRDANALARMSRRSGAAIACVTGFHLAHYYPGGRRPWSDAAQASALFVKEVQVELTETSGRRAAAIKAAHSGVVTADLLAWEAAVEAQRTTGACLLVHTERGAGVIELLAWLDDRGVPPTRVYLCHVDKRPDLELHTELAEAGALLGYDTFLRPHYRPEVNVWPLLKGMVAAGLQSSIAVCLDLAPAEMWRSPHGGPVALLTTIAARLAAEFDDRSTVSGLLGDNVLHRLAGDLQLEDQPAGATQTGAPQTGAEA